MFFNFMKKVDVKKNFGYKEVSRKDLVKVNGGKRKKHRCRVYNNGMPTGMYRWC